MANFHKISDKIVFLKINDKLFLETLFRIKGKKYFVFFIHQMLKRQRRGVNERRKSIEENVSERFVEELCNKKKLE